MDYKPLVTIVIPLYNGANYIREAISCALNQTYPRIEIIVVNDGSRDDGAGENIVKEYFGMVMYYKKENGGVSSALNFAIRQAKGEWVSWLSHDDQYDCHKIEKQMEYVNRLLDIGVDIQGIMVHCNASLIDCCGKKIVDVDYIKYDGFIDSRQVILENLRHNRLGGCSFLLPINCFQKVGFFNDQIRTVSDFDFWYRMLFHGYKFYQLCDRLVSYRVHESQVTYSMKDLSYLEMNRFFIWCADNIINSPLMKGYLDISRVYLYAVEKGYTEAQKHCYSLLKNDGNTFEWAMTQFKLPFALIVRWLRLLERNLFMILKVNR